MTEHEKRLIDEKFTSAADRNDAYRRLEAREPLAYILGEWYFYGETYHVTPDVLIPRSDTEILVEAAIRRIPRGGVFADLCTGSGCIAVSVLCHRPDLTAIAVDISDSALKIAHKNAVINGVDSRVEFLSGDITSDGFAESLLHYRTFDALLSNPPYIKSEIIGKLESEVLAEPLIALDGGYDGLHFYRALKQLRNKILKSDGITLLEIGYDQAESLLCLFCGGEILKDYGGNNRVFII
ncbi:MAG: peptide chain release factor N(5)-glutamine methyltransferase [Eubacteriales bacterium]